MFLTHLEQPDLYSENGFDYKKGTACAHWRIFKNNNLLDTRFHQACHAGLSTEFSKNISLVLGTTYPKKLKDGAYQFHDWIMDEKKSPWRIITQFKDELGWLPNRRALVVGPDIVNSIDNKFVKNFAIALRFTGEYGHNRLPAWIKLVNYYKLDPRDAYFITGWMTIPENWDEKKPDDFYFMPYGGHTGAHWPLTWIFDRKDPYKFSWDKYWNGAINKNENGSINGFFHGLTKKDTYGRLSQINFSEQVVLDTINQEKTIEVYLKWKEYNGLDKYV